MEQVVDNKLSTIKPQNFYGSNIYRKSTGNCLNEVKVQPVPFILKRLLGPCSIWKVFKKQADVLAFVNSKKCGLLMSFVFQQSSGERLFLAAHPRWLWYHDSQKDPGKRCTYEIIPEFTVCKLYFDIEFNTDINPLHNGREMLETFIAIVNHYIEQLWNIKIDRKFVLDLDSSTELKFSRHLIFHIPGAVFRDNYNVGNFVKFICKEIRLCTHRIIGDSNYCSDFMKACHIEDHLVRNLTVTDIKGRMVLFCDEGVYTKNRHFRVFKSTKVGKNSPLVVSKENQYDLLKTMPPENLDEEIFLNSLITYIPDNRDTLRILEFFSDDEDVCSRQLGKNLYNNTRSESSQTSPFPKIDKFIETFIHPGRIWRSVYFQTSNVIVYDIVGNKFCGNIGRQHRSNNVKQIVDVRNRIYYQKCYDPDCASYRSPPQDLPPEVQFHLENEVDCEFSAAFETVEESLNLQRNKYSSLLDCEDQDEELAEVLDVVEHVSQISDDLLLNDFK